MTPLGEAIRAEIRRDGPMRFDRYMARCLDAYYGSGPRIGPEGDFSTSVRFPAFRDAIARLVKASGMGRVVELGAGTGALAKEILSRGYDIEYVTVDASPGLRAKQEAAGARAVASLAELDPAPSLVFGNEVLDALPVRRIVGGPKGLFEICVDLDASGKLRDKLVACETTFPGVAPARGQICDVAPELPSFVKAAARLADPGHLVFIDYGDPAETLYASTRLNGTLAAYRAHGKLHDWYDHIGEQDLTADVDWTAVARAATEAGMEELGLISQARFLTALGVEDQDLVSPARLGSAFQVAAFRRGVPRGIPGF